MPDGSPPARLPVRATLAERPPGLLESWQISQRNVLGLIPAEALERPVLSGTGGARWHMAMHPDAVRRVLNLRAEDYPKSDIARAVLRPAIGESMIVAEGADWRRQRRSAAPAFQPRHVTDLGPVMTAAAERASARMAARQGHAVNLLDEMTSATFEVIADTTLSGGAGSGTAVLPRDMVQRAIEAYGAAAGRMSFLDVLGAPDWVPRPARMRDAPEMARLKQMADATVAARRQAEASATPDLLDLLLRAESPADRGLSARDIRDNLLAFIVAGHETTALTLAWALYLCGFDPAVQDRARAEAQAVLGSRPAVAADLPRLPLVRAVLDETLRLYPPAAFLSRKAVEPDLLCGADIQPGDVVTVPVYAIHRHRALWRDPDAFDPQRFLDGPPPRRYTYLPFGDGPRVCIGARFALQEAAIILATLLARFRFAAIPGKDPVPTLLITLRPEGGVWLTVEAA